MDNQLVFRRLGTMLDCSRNAVPTVSSAKKWIDITSDIGYNTLLLYTEDTYEVDDNPYFGYMRGRFSQQELQELDMYAVSKGMELIPCIQVLGHLGTIQRWPEYWPHFDAPDILLVGDERVYALIEKMFSSIAKCFTSKTIHLGMDEAHMIGRGRYYDQHGDTDRTQIMIDHLKRIGEIGQKYGFNFLMWSDMFFKLATNSLTYDSNAVISDEVKSQIPDNVQLVYWDYYTESKAEYDKILNIHNQVKENTWFAGGLLSWTGFSPHNAYSMRLNETALASCRDNGVQDVFFCLWGDCGAECSRFSLIPSLFHASELAKGNTNIECIKKKFYEKFAIAFDDFALLDLPGTPNGRDDLLCNAEKYLFYNDYFTGLMNHQISGGEGQQFAECAVALDKMCSNRQWGYIFETLKALCHVLEIKAELSLRTKKAYQEKDIAAIQNLIGDYHEVYQRIKRFHQVYRQQWFLENKPHGFDVQDLRIGGLLARTESCMERLQSFCSGEISIIEELEEKQLDFFGTDGVRRQPDTMITMWEYIASTNVIATNFV